MANPMDPFALLLVVLMIWGPAFDSGEGNRCYKVGYAMESTWGPCRADETAGYGRRR